jgi:hypothetical protein
MEHFVIVFAYYVPHTITDMEERASGVNNDLFSLGKMSSYVFL